MGERTRDRERRGEVILADKDVGGHSAKVEYQPSLGYKLKIISSEWT